VWQLEAPAEMAFHGGDTMKVATFNADGTRLLTTTTWKAQVWAVGGESMTAAAPSAITLDPGSQLYHARFAPDGGRVVTCSEDGLARVWDARTGKVLASFQHERRVEDAVFTRDGTLLATTSGDQVCVWNTRTGERRRCMGGGPEGYPVVHVEFDREAKRVLGVDFGGALRVWEVDTGSEIPFLARADVHLATYSQDGRWVATAEKGATAHVMDATTGASVTPEIKLQYRITSLVFSPDGTRLLTGDQGGVARLWDTAHGTAVGPPLEHTGSVIDGAFSQDGLQVVTVAADVRLWDAATGASLTPPRKDNVNHAEFAPGGRAVATAGEDGVARVWDVSASSGSIDELIHLAGAYAVRRLDEGGALVALTTEQFREDWRARPARK
jgi:WD40 repeat protein